MSNQSTIIRRAALAGGALSLTIGLSACGGGMGGTASTPAPQAPSSAPMSSMPASSSPTSSGSMSASPSSSMSASGASAAFGPGCAAVPTSGKGSFDGMSQDPVATAASNNPALSTLVSAVKKAKLGDTLNSAEDITVFAPSNDAFKKLDKKTLDKAMGDPDGLLTDVLTAHVVQGRLTPQDLAGSHQTLNKKAKVTVKGSGEDFTVNGNAKVVCGNVQTANATVYIVDQVLLPKS